MFESVLVSERGTLVNVRPGTECVAHVPYVFNGTEETYYRDVQDRRLTIGRLRAMPKVPFSTR